MGVIPAALDLSYASALPVKPYQARRIALVIVGLGGTGSFLARHAACLLTLLRGAGKEATLTFIDPDTVEEANIPRQNFCRAEIGRYKVETLARRYCDAFGIEIACLPERFEPEMAEPRWDTLTMLVGCVDRASGRVDMGEALKENRRFVEGKSCPRIWYLDLGNGLDFGQLALGSTDREEDMAPAFSLSPLGCVSLLPSPLLQLPKLREPQAEELAGHALSCAELLAANAQSLMINPRMADEGASYLYEFLVLGTLRRFATFIDIPTGTMRSRYTTPEQLAEAISREPSFFGR
jgi:PRTRC genetic system ThiF family protein